jgi:hypothetical protein
MGSDEGRAMAEIVHAIAPGAAIAFQSPEAEPDTDVLSAFAHAVRDLQALHVQIIVDDIGYKLDPSGEPGEPNFGGEINDAIDTAVLAGISYFTAGGNDRVATDDGPALPLFGHTVNPLAVTVAAANWLQFQIRRR